MKVEDMKDIFYLFLNYPQRFFHLQIMHLSFFFQRMVIEILFNHKIQFFSFEIIHIFTHTHKIICVHYWKKFMNKYFIFSFGQLINKIWIIKFEVV
jgi:hypothetical protein